MGLPEIETSGQGPLTLFNPHGLEMFKMVGMEAIAKSLPMRWAAREQARLADRVVSLGGGMTDETRRFLGWPAIKLIFCRTLLI